MTRGQIRYNRSAGTIENMGAESMPLEEVKTDAVETLGAQSQRSGANSTTDEDENTMFEQPKKDYEATCRWSPSPAATKVTGKEATAKGSVQEGTPRKASVKKEASIAGVFSGGLGVPAGTASTTLYYLPGMIQCSGPSVQEGDDEPFDKDK